MIRGRIGVALLLFSFLPHIAVTFSILKLHRQATKYHHHLLMLPNDDIGLLFLADSASSIVSDVAQPDDVVIQQLSKETTIAVFIIGIIPFAIATYEFWRRIAVGASFGTNDPIVFVTTIGEDNAPTSSRGKQVLGKDSLITAYLIFAVCIGVLGLVLYSVATSPDPALSPWLSHQQQS